MNWLQIVTSWKCKLYISKKFKVEINEILLNFRIAKNGDFLYNIVVMNKRKLKVYLDNCCFNRPFDDQMQLSISLETQSKLVIQELIRRNKLVLYTSFMLYQEISDNPYEYKRTAIKVFVENYESYYIGLKHKDNIWNKAKQIMLSGIKEKDAIHISCAIYQKCDAFITTDKRLMKYDDKEIKIYNPIEFINHLEEIGYEWYSKW